MKPSLYRIVCMLIAVAMCWGLAFPATVCAAPERSFERILEELDEYLAGNTIGDTVLGNNGDAPFDLMREALLACGSEFATYEAGNIKFYGEIWLAYDAPSRDASWFCKQLSEYGNSSYHGETADGWERLAEAFLPLLEDARLEGAARVFAEDLYAICCLAGLSRPFSDYVKAMKAKDFSAYYAAHIAPVSDAEKTRILDAMAFQDDVLNPLPDLVAVYAKQGKADCVSDSLMDALIWRYGIPAFAAMLTDLHEQGTAWEGLFAQAERVGKENDPEKFAYGCAQALAIAALQETVPCALALLGNQYYDPQSSSIYQLAAKKLDARPRELQERLRAGASGATGSGPNLFVRWPANVASLGIPFTSTGDGFILLSKEENQYSGVYEYQLPPDESFSQCEQIAALLAGTATLVANPKDARVGLEFCCSYPFAGYYGTNNMSAYDCTLAVRALDLATGKEIAAASFENTWGFQITVSAGTSIVYKSIPHFSDEEFAEDAQAFCDKVTAYLGT